MSADKEAGRAGSLFEDFLREQGDLDAASAEAEQRVREWSRQPANARAGIFGIPNLGKVGRIAAASPPPHSKDEVVADVRYRSASTGRFVSTTYARSNPATTTKVTTAKDS